MDGVGVASSLVFRTVSRTALMICSVDRSSLDSAHLSIPASAATLASSRSLLSFLILLVPKTLGCVGCQKLNQGLPFGHQGCELVHP